MDFFEKIKNRYNIMNFVLIVLVVGLSLRLAVLTIAQGDYYRELSNNKRLKEVYTNAPRGEIRDRNGILLAGNKPSFAIRLFKDEINLYKPEEKNQAFLDLVRLMEEDGVNYVDEFPIELNVFKYNSESDYLIEEDNPTEKVINIILEKDLIGDILRSHYTYEGYGEHYRFITANRAINALQFKGMDIPIDLSLEGGQVVFAYDENKDIDAWKEEYKLDKNDSPLASIIRLIGEDKTIIRKIISHSLSRELVYNILLDKGLAGNIILEEYAISYMEDYLEQKRNLMQTFPGITMETSALDDFVLMFSNTSLENFLSQVFTPSEEGKKIIPADIAKKVLKDKGIELPISWEASEEGGLIFTNSNNNKMSQEEIIEDFAQTLRDAKLLKTFLSMEDIKSLAQSQLLKDGVNPRISIAKKFEYVAINNLNNFYTANKITGGTSIEESFEQLKKNYGLVKEFDKLSIYEARGIFVLYNQVQKQGYLAYQPIYLAYGLKNSTVAKIEEGLMGFSGVDISLEAVRFYPEGKSAAHLLGYLGKISQTGEIEKYIKERGYSPSTIIGKTGIEESFEEELSGTYGIKTIEVDSVGNTTRVIKEVKPIPGDNINLSIDLKVQKVAEEALEQTLTELQKAGTYKSPWGNFAFGRNRSKGRPYNRATSGALVAVDVKTGQVIASVSYPSYDPNLFSTGISDSDWQSLLPEDDKNPLAPRPLYNLATQSPSSPGSIYKMLTALTAMEKGLSPTKKIRDMGYIDVGGGNKKACLLWTNSRRTHGYVDVYGALQESCNYYFYTLAYGNNPRTGEYVGAKVEVEDMAEMASKLGLNDKTGIEINSPAEVVSGVPDRQLKVGVQKGNLRRFLNANIDSQFKDGFDYDEDYKKEVVEEIVSWTEEETILTRGEVIRRMEELNIEAERPIPGDRNRTGLADAVKYTYLDYASWKITDTMDLTIGQGYASYTPIQMANYVSTMVNGGYRNKLTLIDSVNNYNDSQIKYKREVETERIELNKYSHLDDIKKGMLQVSTKGTAKGSFGNFPIKTGTKTGTVQRSGLHPVTKEPYDDFSWFVGFAPYDDPEIAVAAVIYQGGSGGYSGPMVRDVIAEYLGLNDTVEEEADNNDQ